MIAEQFISLVAAIAALFVLATVVAVAQSTKADRNELERVETAIAELKDKRKDNKKFLRLVDDIRAFDDGQQIWVDVLYDVFSVLPPHQEFVITHVDLNQKEGMVTLKTKAKSRDTVNEVIDGLHDFRRQGRALPRFRVEMGGQKDKKGEKYPIVQNLRIEIREDEIKKRA